jgi:hypothetical protein
MRLRVRLGWHGAQQAVQLGDLLAGFSQPRNLRSRRLQREGH